MPCDAETVGRTLLGAGGIGGVAGFFLGAPVWVFAVSCGVIGAGVGVLSCSSGGTDEKRLLLTAAISAEKGASTAGSSAADGLENLHELQRLVKALRREIRLLKNQLEASQADSANMKEELNKLTTIVNRVDRRQASEIDTPNSRGRDDLSRLKRAKRRVERLQQNTIFHPAPQRRARNIEASNNGVLRAEIGPRF